MPAIRRHARVPYTAAQMFDLVNDIEAYPKFLHWCRAARIEARTDATIDAVLDIGIGGVHKSFKTRNTLQRPGRIDIALLVGPFRRLEGAWTFADAGEGGADIELSLDYEVSHSPLAFVFSAVFEEVARAQLNAFVRRAEQLYG